MKKIATLLLGFSLILTGCSSSKKVDGLQVAASVDGYNVTAEDLYEELSDPAGDGSSFFSFLVQKLINDKFPVTKEMKEKAQDYVDKMKNSFIDTYGEDQYETYMNEYLSSQLNLSSVDEYKERLIKTLQQAAFLQNYVDNNFDKVFEDYVSKCNPAYASIIKVSVSDMDDPTSDEINKKQEVEALLKTSKSFSDIAKDYSDDQYADEDGSLGLVDTTSEISSRYCTEVEDAIYSLKVGSTSSAIKGDDGYYYVHINSRDQKKMKKELKSAGIDSPLLVYNDYIYYLAYKEYDIQIKDKDLKNKIDTLLDNILSASEDS